MATFTISISGSAVVNGSKNWAVADADIQTLSTFMIAKYSSPGQAQLTAPQALSAWAQDFVNRTIAEVRSYQQSQAAVSPIVFT